MGAALCYLNVRRMEASWQSHARSHLLMAPRVTTMSVEDPQQRFHRKFSIKTRSLPRFTNLVYRT